MSAEEIRIFLPCTDCGAGENEPCWWLCEAESRRFKTLDDEETP